MKKLLTLALAMLFAMQLSAQTTTVVVGDSNSVNNSGWIPLYCYYQNSYSQSIYPASELNAGLIQSISYYKQGGADFNNGTVKIYMKEVDDITLSGFLSGDGFVEVYSGALNLHAGCVTYQLSTPFVYTGAGNLCVAVIRDGTSWSNGHNFVVTAGSSVRAQSDGDEYFINAIPSWGVNTMQQIPVTKFEMASLEGYCFPPSNVVASQITNQGALISWETTEETLPTFGIAYRAEGETEWNVVDEGVNALSYELTGLDSYTNYEVKVYTMCSESNSTDKFASFITLPADNDYIDLPYSQNFDDMDMVSEWHYVQVANNKWYIGSAVNNTRQDGELTDGNALFVSNDNGLTNAYDPTPEQVSNAFVLLNVEANNYYGITFDLKSQGESASYAWDYTVVSVVPFAQELSTDIVPSNSYRLGEIYSTNNEWRTISYPFPALEPGAYKVVFTWRNDGGGAAGNPPAAIDNVEITSSSCARVNSFVAELEDAGSSVTMSLTVNDTVNTNAEYVVEYRATGEEEWSSTSGESPVQVEGLPYTSRVEYRVIANCDGENAIMSDTYEIYTLCNTVTEFPFVENFDENSYIPAIDTFKADKQFFNCWYNVNGGYNYAYWSTLSQNYGVDSTKALYYYGTTANESFSDWLITPAFELTGNEMLNFQFKFSYPEKAPIIDVLALDVNANDYSSKADTANFTLVATIDANGLPTNQYNMAEVLLDELSGPTRLALAVRQGSNSFYLDDFSISEIPNCLNVYSLTVRPGHETAYVSYSTGNIADGGVNLAYAEIEEGEVFDPISANIINLPSDQEMPYEISGLTTGATYAFAAQQACDGAWTETVTVTIPVSYTAPLFVDFDDESLVPEMTLASNNQTNIWFIGTADNNTYDEDQELTDGGALYITADNGATTGYNINTSTNATAKILLSLNPAEEKHIAFDWKANGQLGSYYNYDYLSVHVVPYGQEANSSNAVANVLGGATSWRTENITLPASYYGLYELVFKWQTNSYDGNQPGAVIDNLQITSSTCVAQSIVWNLSASEDEDGNAQCVVNLTDTINEGATYTISYKPQSGSVYTEITDLSINDFPYPVSDGIDFQSTYEFQISMLCAGEENAIALGTKTITTPCASLQLPWFESFSTDPYATTCWGKYQGKMPANGIMRASSLQHSYAAYGWGYASNFSCGETTSNMLRSELYGSSTYQYWSISPMVNLGNDGTAKQIAFDLGLRNYSSNSNPGSAPDDQIMILVSLDNGETWNKANGLIFADGDEDTEHNMSDLTTQMQRYAFKLVDENDEPLTGLVRFAFYSESTVNNADNFACLDNVAVEEWAECQAPYNLVISPENITSSSAIVTFQTWGDATSWEYAIAEGENSDLEGQTAYPVESTNTIELTELTPGTVYTIGIRGVCSTPSAYTTATFITLDEPQALPYETTFEEDLWFINSGSATANSWVIGEATGNDAPAAYVSNDEGSYAASQTNIQTISHLWKDFNFGETESDFELSFDWKATGNTTSYGDVVGGIMVYITDITPLPATGMLDPTYRVATLTGAEQWQNERINLGNITGEKRLVFSAIGYTADGELATPAAIDNVSLTASLCDQVMGVVASNPTISTIDVAWPSTGADSYIVTYIPVGVEDAEELTQTTTDTIATLTELISQTQYRISVIGVCSGNESIPSSSVTMTTLQEAVDVPYTCDFEEEGTNGWILRNGNSTNKWYVAVPAGEENAKLFISHNGVAANYNTSSTSVVVAEKLFQLGSTDSIRISFDFRCIGEGRFDYLKVFWLPAETTFDPSSSTSYANHDYTTNTIMSNSTTSSYSFVNNIASTQNLSVTIPNDQNELRKLVFVWKNDNSGGNQPGAIIDNVVVEEVGSEVTCIRPESNSVAASNIATTTATISWTDQDTSHTAWNVYYKATGETEYTSVLATSTSIELTNLLQGTQYSVYVTTVCGEEESAATDIATFTTLCTSVTEFPWFEGFELGLGCWTNSRITGSYYWELSSYFETYHPETENYLELDAFEGNSFYKHTYIVGESAALTTPLLDLSSLENPYIKFNYVLGNYNGSSEELVVKYRTSTESAWVELATLSTPLSEWATDSIALPNPTATYQVRFISDGADGYGVGLDAITVYNAEGAEQQPCDAPTALSASNITETSAEITWNGTATTYEFKLNGGDVETLTTTTKSLTGLTANTTYTVEVRAVCDDQQSAWVTTNFTTLEEQGESPCATITEYPFFESFEEGIGCWTSTTLAGSGAWLQEDWFISMNGFDAVTLPAVDGAKLMKHSAITGYSARLESPVLDLTSLETPYVKFNFGLTDMYGMSQDHLTVKYRTSATAEWTTLATYTTPLSEWVLDSIALPNPTATYQIGFESLGANAWGVVLDAITVYNASAEQGGEDPEPEPCDAPTALSANNITETSAEITWNGTATTYEFKLNGGEAETLTATTKALTGLTPETAYTVEVRAVCEDQTSDWVSATFTTLEQVLPCDAPTALSANNITETSAEITWNGTATTYEFKLNGGEAETLTATTKALTGLTPATAYTVEVRAVCEDQTSDWVSATFTTLEEVVVIAPVVTTLAATEVDHESAVLNASIEEGSEEITAIGFNYKSSTDAEWTTVPAVLPTITAVLTGLTAETTYTFKAFATTASGTVEGAEMTFTTTAAPVVIVAGEVTTSPATEVGNTSATLNGALVSAGNSENYTVGFALATVADFTLEDADVQNIVATLTDNAFSQAVNDLVEGQTYFYRAYITNEAGTAYGAVETFTLSSLADAMANALQVSVYPNPATTQATLKLAGLQSDAKIVISDLQGRILSQDEISASTTTYTIDLNNIASGVYYIRIVADETISTQKLIVE